MKRHDDTGVDRTSPTIIPDEFADNRVTEMEACIRWFSSDARQVEKIESPRRYANEGGLALFDREFRLKQPRTPAGSQQRTAATRRSP